MAGERIARKANPIHKQVRVLVGVTCCAVYKCLLYVHVSQMLQKLIASLQKNLM